MPDSLPFTPESNQDSPDASRPTVVRCDSDDVNDVLPSHVYAERYNDCLAVTIYHMALEARHENVWHSPYKPFYSALSQTCRRWSYIVRPLLFRRLTLWTQQDVELLTNALRSPTSGWLREHIISVMLVLLEHTDIFDRPTWRVLLRELTALKALCFQMRADGNLQSLSASEIYGNRAVLKSSVGRTLKYLALSNVFFESFPNLCRLVGSFDGLRGIFLENVRWDLEGDKDSLGEKEVVATWASGFPKCTARFLSLELASAERSLDTRALVAFFAASSLRQRCSIRYDEGTGQTSEFQAVIQLVTVIFDIGETCIVARRIHDDKYAYAWSIRLTSDSEVVGPTCTKHTSLTIVTCPTPSSTSKNDSEISWSVQHLIVACMHEAEHFPSYPIPKIHNAIEEFLGKADNALAGFEHLQTVDVMYSEALVEREDVTRAATTIRRSMPKTGKMVRLIPYDLKEGSLHVEIGDAGVVLEPIKEWWRSDLLYEI